MDKLKEFFKIYKNPLIITLIIVGTSILLILILTFIFNRIIKRQKNKRAITVTRLIRSILRYLVVIIVIIALLGVWGVDIMPIITGVGIAGLVIGLGAQTLIKDLIAGIAIVFDDFYEIDDVVEINGFKGKVIDIGLKSTRLQNWKGEIKIISNGDITEVINFSRNPSVGVVDIEIAYQENINMVFKLIEDNLEQIKEEYPQIIEGPNIIGIIDVGNAVTIRITAKTASEQHYAVERGIRKYLKELFEANDIEMPFNKTIIYDEKSTDKL
jgi:small conductance mechanosensitive channel